jgi:hypothetical protein
MCAATITTQYAAEAILMLCQMFSMEPEEDLPSWIEELKLHFPDLAAAVFTASRDE